MRNNVVQEKTYNFAYKLQIAYKEARESKFWLRLFKDSDILEQPLADSLIADAEEIIKILVSILKTTKENNTRRNRY